MSIAELRPRTEQCLQYRTRFFRWSGRSSRSQTLARRQKRLISLPASSVLCRSDSPESRASPLGALTGQLLGLGVEDCGAVMELPVLVVEALDRIMVFPSRHTHKVTENFVICGQPNGHGQRKREYPCLQKFHKKSSCLPDAVMPAPSPYRLSSSPYTL
jgi:hypothetical protein